MEKRMPLSPPIGLQEEASTLYSWARERGATQSQCDRILGLLSVQWMCDLPLPPRTRQSPGVTDTLWHRFLFRRHIQHILGWTHRLPEGDPAGFSDAVNSLIRTRFYPDQIPQRHGETPGGGEEQASAGEARNCGDHTIPGQGEREFRGDQLRRAHGGCDGRSGAGDAERALGARDRGIQPTARKPGRILPKWCTREGETGTRVRPWESCAESFPTSPILLEYQQFMCGIDVLDQTRVEYTVQLQSHKWWHRLLLFVLDTSCQNAYVLYREDATQVGLHVQSRLLWHYTLGMRLLQPWLTGGAVRGPHRQLTPPGFHRIEGHPTSRRACVVCSNRTRRFCRGCAGAFMCADACYIAVHTQPGHAVNFRL